MQFRRTLTGVIGRFHVNLMKFNEAKGEVLHVGWGNPKHKCRLKDQGTESSAEEKGLGGMCMRAH